MALRRLVLAVVLAASSAGVAHAQAKKAALHFKKGTAAYAAKRYDVAIREFEAAFVARPDPAFLYNLGQVYRTAKKPDKALNAYQKYLKMAPIAPNRAEVEQQIAELERELKPVEEAKPVEKPAEPVIVPVPVALPPPGPDLVAAEPAKPRRWPIVVGVGAAVVIVAAAAVVAAVLWGSRPLEPSAIGSAR